MSLQTIVAELLTRVESLERKMRRLEKGPQYVFWTKPIPRPLHRRKRQKTKLSREAWRSRPKRG